MNEKLYVLAGPASKDLANKVAKNLNAELIDVELRIFPDGESKIKIDGELSNKFVVIVQSTYPPVDTHMMQILLMINKAKKMNANVCAVIPYLAYARQDKEFVKGEAVSMELIGSLFNSSGAKNIITVDIHSEIASSQFAIPVHNVSAIPLLANYFKSQKLTEPLVASPDLGGSARAEEFAKIIGTDSISLPKSRDRDTGEVSIEESKLSANVKGRDVILVDDIISTGASIVKATEVLTKLGCGKLYATCAHALLLNNALDKIRSAGVSDVVGSNTVPSTVSKVDVTPAISDQIIKIAK
ncbi:MAG: ribose-phosphate diphosphokinase [Nitrososphaerales archaeon]